MSESKCELLVFWSFCIRCCTQIFDKVNKWSFFYLLPGALKRWRLLISLLVQKCEIRDETGSTRWPNSFWFLFCFTGVCHLRADWVASRLQHFGICEHGVWQTKITTAQITSYNHTKGKKRRKSITHKHKSLEIHHFFGAQMKICANFKAQKSICRKRCDKYREILLN